MRRRGVWRRRLTRAVATLGIGVLLGFLVPSIIADLSPKPEAQARTAESPVAAKAARVKAEYIKVDPPVHLGSWVIGNGLSLHAYASHVVDNEGTDDQLAWRVATQAGRVELIDPPPSVQTP